MSQTSLGQYGVGDGSFQAAGGEAGIKQLAFDFYDIMSTKARYESIFTMHSRDINLSIDRLACFLCGWMGGPKLYRKYFGPISIPQVHEHLKISNDEKGLWLDCMQEAVDKQNYVPEFKRYLMHQLSLPAEVIRQHCAMKMMNVKN